jgi:hypothetical protein
MKPHRAARPLLVFILVAASAAARAGASRAEVLDALAEARRTGDLIAPGDSGRTLRELAPGLYPAPPAQAALARADVVGALREALRTGDIAIGDSGRTAYELNPGAYPARMPIAGRSREEVRADLAQALRTGDIMASGDSGQTLRERYPERYAPTALAAARGNAMAPGC